MKPNKLWIILFLMPTLIIFTLIFAYPLITVVITSFFETKGNEYTFIGLDNYEQLLFNDKTFTKAFTNTIIWIILQVTVHVSIGVAVGIMLVKKPFGWKFIRTSFMLPNVISLSSLGLIYINVFHPSHGVLNGILGALGFRDDINWYFNPNTAFGTVTYTWLIFAGLVAILVMAEIMSIDESIYESAKVDGASGLQLDFFITLPLIKGSIATCMILSATSMLKEFELIYLTTNGGPGITTMNLPLYLYKTSMLEGNYGYANAISTITIILGIAIIFAITKIFRLGKSDI